MTSINQADGLFTVAFAVTETGPSAGAGDYFTALELGSALNERFGWQVQYRSKGNDWYQLAGVDLLIVMVDEFEVHATQNAPDHLLTVAWARNWFDKWCTHPWASRYDLHFASSQQAVDFMSQQIGKRARLLRIATNPRRFNSSHRSDAPELDYVFTGSYWGAERDIIDALRSAPPSYRGAVYGKHWEKIPALAHLYRGFLPYQQMPQVYASAKIVIDDANHVTKAWGAANSRVFDALAAGCLVITNSKSVSNEVFDGQLPVYNNPDELVQLLHYFLNNDSAREERLQVLRDRVITRHCYHHRAMEFGWVVGSLFKPGIDLKRITRPLRGGAL